MQIALFLVLTVVTIAIVGWIAVKYGGMFPELRGTDSETVRHAKVLRRGLSGMGVVSSVTKTDKTAGDDSLMILKLMVRTQDWKPYEVTVQTMFKTAELARLVPGAELPVKIDPRNPDSVALVF
ncbi:MAG TPA: hypothetical protein PKV72_05805 [Candidatus Peribacteria bacterium]|nr:hypothetical protein [Candidatus Peribacteria bacterium]